MKSKIVYIDKVGNETIVATFNTINEASVCRDLLQAKCSDQENCYYYVDAKINGQLTRRGADTFAKQVLYLAKEVQQNIRLMLC
jgi:hypothetical protein